ncbi:hypothetical protein AB205_0121140 [Aquarana catesbeiana]|uniref:Uncharacterized protein n=1 Tax=Aquarana catesbeiana TaxID=8400 RepID=A0A2G9RMR9_AQUCT|nr:hypothetical protein AB205_0121140 [Aquarana catesbeiana]
MSLAGKGLTLGGDQGVKCVFSHKLHTQISVLALVHAITTGHAHWVPRRAAGARTHPLAATKGKDVPIRDFAQESHCAAVYLREPVRNRLTPH